MLLKWLGRRNAAIANIQLICSILYDYFTKEIHWLWRRHGLNVWKSNEIRDSSRLFQVFELNNMMVYKLKDVLHRTQRLIHTFQVQMPTDRRMQAMQPIVGICVDRQLNLPLPFCKLTFSVSLDCQVTSIIWNTRTKWNFWSCLASESDSIPELLNRNQHDQFKHIQVFSHATHSEFAM